MTMTDGASQAGLARAPMPPGASGQGEVVLRTHGLTKRFGKITAVNNLSIEARAGEVLGFLGPNGSGKSTTVGMIMGLIRPTAGRVELFGQDVREHGELVSERVGAIIENPAFYPFLSGRDNLIALAKVLGNGAEARVDSLLAQVRMSERADGKYKTYSLGMKQRLGIASTLLNDPKLIILDEPTNGLDPAGQREIREFIPELAREGRAVVLASHLLHEVEHVCDRVVIIRRGEVIEYGAVRDLVQRGGYMQVTVTPEEQRAAFDVLRQMPGVQDVRAAEQPGGVIILADPSLGRDINQRLAGQGIYASAIVPRVSSLEDIFLDLTEGSSPGEQANGAVGG